MGRTSVINSYVTPRTTAKAVVAEDLAKLVDQMVFGQVMYFTTIVERTAKLAKLVTLGLGSPPAGAISHISTLSRYDRYDGTNWVPLPYQEVVDAVDISAAGALYTTAGTTELDLGRLAHPSVQVFAGQLYRHDIQLIASRTVAADEFELRLRKDTALTGTLVAAATAFQVSGTIGQQIGATLLWASTVTETTSLFLSIVRTGASATMTVFGQISTRSRSHSIMSRLGPSTRYRTIAV